MYEFKYMNIKQIRTSHINDTPGIDSFVGGGLVGLLLHKKLHLTHFPLSDSAKQLNRESNTNTVMNVRDFCETQPTASIG